MTHAIMAVDPGGTTGLAACYFDLQPTLKETLLGARNKKSIEVYGDWLEQSAKISTYMSNFAFRANVEHSIPIPNIHFVFEDFILRKLRSGGATGNLTSCWVAAGTVAMFCHTIVQKLDGTIESLVASEADFINWQQASQAKGFATDDRLRLWDMWSVGSAHERDAWRHLACLANGIVL